MSERAGDGIAPLLEKILVRVLPSGVAAFTLAEMAVHLWFGNHAVQGGEVHFAVMGAAVLGTAFGVVMARYFQRGVTA